MNNDECIQKLRKIKQMSKQFGFKNFYETQPHIAIIVITPFDVIIVTSDVDDKNEYKNHFDILDDIYDFMKLYNRTKYQLWAFHCTSEDEEHLDEQSLVFSLYEVEDIEFKRGITKEMCEVGEIICKIVSIIGKNNNFEIASWEQIKKFHHLEPTEELDALEAEEPIGIPISEFIEMLKKQLFTLEHSYNDDCRITLNENDGAR